MSREGFRNFLSQYTAVGCYVQLSNLACFMEQWICYEVTTFRNTLCEHLQTEKILVNVLNSTQAAPCPAPCAASPVPVPAGIPEPAEAGDSDTSHYHGMMVPWTPLYLLGSHVPHEILHEVFINSSILFLWNFSSRSKYTCLAENRAISEGSSAGRAGTSCSIQQPLVANPLHM